MVCLLHARSLICGLLYIVPSTFSISSYNHKLINTNLKILSLYPQTLIIQSSRFFNPSKTQIKSSKMSSNPSSSSTSGCSGGGGGGGSSSGGGGAGGGPCGACKFLRRKCVAGCVFAPFFDSDQGAAHFAAVHKVFGASNVSKLLLHLPVQRRQEAVVTICYEAQARLRDPIYGCVSHIFALQQQVMNLQAELAYIHAYLATLVPPLPPPPPPPQQTTVPPPGLTINDLTTASSPFLSCYDLSSLLEPMVPPSWTMQSPRRQTDPRQFIGFGEAPNAPTGLPPAQGGGSTSGEFQELARELLQRSDCESSRKNEGPSLPP